MKTTVKILIGVCLAAAALSCTKEVLRTQGGIIATKTVEAGAGSFIILVSADGVWSASTPQEWIHVSPDYHKGEYAVYVEYDTNESTEAIHRFNRAGYIVLNTFDKATSDTVMVHQKGLEPLISLPVSFKAVQGINRIPLTTNLTDFERPGIGISCSNPAITGMKWTEDGEAIEFQASEAVPSVIEITYSPVWGNPLSVSCNIEF